MAFLSSDPISMVVFIVIIINGIFSYLGFKNPRIFEKYLLDVTKVLAYKEYVRIISSGFLHGSWMHLIFNMLSLYFFGPIIEKGVGIWQFIVIYFVSLLFGNLFSIFVHRHKSNYRAVGASGAVSGIIFATIAMNPFMSLRMFMIIPIPGWAFALGFMLFSIYGIRKQSGNIGHEAHLAGGIFGLICAVVLVPEIMTTNYWMILLILVPSVVFISILVLKPNVLLTKDIIARSGGLQTIDDQFNEQKRIRQIEIDQILEKIHAKGIDSLTNTERKKLDEYSSKD